MLTGEGQHGIGSHLDRPVELPSEVNSQEGESRIGYRVDESVDQVLRPSPQGVILTAEWNNPDRSVHAR